MVGRIFLDAVFKCVFFTVKMFGGIKGDDLNELTMIVLMRFECGGAVLFRLSAKGFFFVCVCVEI